jgi:hypothetical protein
VSNARWVVLNDLEFQNQTLSGCYALYTDTNEDVSNAGIPCTRTRLTELRLARLHAFSTRRSVVAATHHDRVSENRQCHQQKILSHKFSSQKCSTNNDERSWRFPSAFDFRIAFESSVFSHSYKPMNHDDDAAKRAPRFIASCPKGRGVRMESRANKITTLNRS